MAAATPHTSTPLNPPARPKANGVAGPVPPSAAAAKIEEAFAVPPNTVLFIRNLKFLDLDLLPDWPGLDTRTFSPSLRDAHTTQKDRVRCVEWVLYRLFERWDPKETKKTLSPFFPAHEPAQSLKLRAALCQALTQLKANGVLGKQCTIRKTMLDDCRGERLEEVLFEFSTAVLQKSLHERSAQQPSPSTAQKLATNPSLTEDDLKNLAAPLLASHIVSLRKSFAERDFYNSRFRQLLATLDTQREQLETNAIRTEDVLSSSEAALLDAGVEIKTMKKTLRDGCPAGRTWLNIAISGEPVQDRNEFLETKFADIWSATLKEEEPALTKMPAGLVADLDQRVERQSLRLQEWRGFQRELSKRNESLISLKSPFKSPSKSPKKGPTRTPSTKSPRKQVAPFTSSRSVTTRRPSTRDGELRTIAALNIGSPLMSRQQRRPGSPEKSRDQEVVKKEPPLTAQTKIDFGPEIPRSTNAVKSYVSPSPQPPSLSPPAHSSLDSPWIPTPAAVPQPTLAERAAKSLARSSSTRESSGRPLSPHKPRAPPSAWKQPPAVPDAALTPMPSEPESVPRSALSLAERTRQSISINHESTGFDGDRVPTKPTGVTARRSSHSSGGRRPSTLGTHTRTKSAIIAPRKRFPVNPFGEEAEAGYDIGASLTGQDSVGDPYEFPKMQKDVETVDEQDPSTGGTDIGTTDEQESVSAPPASMHNNSELSSTEQTSLEAVTAQMNSLSFQRNQRLSDSIQTRSNDVGETIYSPPSIDAFSPRNTRIEQLSTPPAANDIGSDTHDIETPPAAPLRPSTPPETLIASADASSIFKTRSRLRRSPPGSARVSID